MTAFVLDNSVAMRWLLESEKATDQDYVIDVLKSMKVSSAIVPQLWHLEAANVLLVAEKRNEITVGEAEQFIAQLENLPLHVDQMTEEQAFNRTYALAKAYNLSSYDGSYLELAVRLGLPLATLDKELKKAAKKAEVSLYLS